LDAANDFARQTGASYSETCRANYLVLRSPIFQNEEPIAQAFLLLDMDSLSALCLCFIAKDGNL